MHAVSLKPRRTISILGFGCTAKSVFCTHCSFGASTLPHSNLSDLKNRLRATAYIFFIYFFIVILFD